MTVASPSVGDFIVSGCREGFVIERIGPGNDREHVVTEKHRLAALEAARVLARGAKRRAWTYELDNTCLEIQLH